MSTLPDCYPETIVYSGSATLDYTCDNFFIHATPSNTEYAKSTVARTKRHYSAFGGSYDMVGNLRVYTDPVTRTNTIYSIRVGYAQGETANIFDTIVTLDRSVTPVNINAVSEIPSGLPIYADFTVGIPGTPVEETKPVLSAVGTITWPDVNAVTNLKFTFIDTDVKGRWNLRVDVSTVQGMALYLNSYTDARQAEPDLQSSNFFLPAGYGVCPTECGTQCPILYISASTDVYGGKNLAQSVCWITGKNKVKGELCSDITYTVQELGICELYQTVFSRYPFKINCFVKGEGSLARKVAKITHEKFPGAWAETIEKRIIMFALYRYFIGYFVNGRFDVNDVLNSNTKSFNQALAASPYACWSAIFEHKLLQGFNNFFYWDSSECCPYDDEGCEDGCGDLKIDELDISEDLKQRLRRVMMSNQEKNPLPAKAVKY